MAYEGWALLLDGVQTVGIIGGAGWAFWRFRRERVHAPQVEFSIDAAFYGPSEGQYIAEYILTFANKGKTRVQITNIELRVRGIQCGENPQDWSGRAPRVWFPHKLVGDEKVMPENYEYTFFEPGITQEYRYISRVPAEFRFLLVRGQFFYDADHPHSAERVVTVKAKEELS